MINFREIFNIKYSIIALSIIIVILFLIILINQNISKSSKAIGITLTISGFISLILSFIIIFGLNLIIPSEYIAFINVISNNLEKNLIIYSGLSIIIGIISIVISNITNKEIE